MSPVFIGLDFARKEKPKNILCRLGLHKKVYGEDISKEGVASTTICKRCMTVLSSSFTVKLDKETDGWKITSADEQAVRKSLEEEIKENTPKHAVNLKIAGEFGFGVERAIVVKLEDVLSIIQGGGE